MYYYSACDQNIVDQRVIQFRSQTERYLAGELSEEEFRPLRLQNGVYIQRHAPMLRVAVPYGNVSAVQLRALAHIASHYDRGYAHFTTRQNIQFNWPALQNIPDILAYLATVQMHAIQTSGNCIRNTTSDPFAGVAADERVDPRPWCEIIRQWSTLHPEFAFLPRKFKIAVNGAVQDRALIQAHDIGLDVHFNAAGELGFRVLVGGGLGRTPMLGQEIIDFLPWQHLLSYCEAILRVYNLHGRRDNLYKARIKILVKSLGIETFRQQVDAEFARLKDGAATLSSADVAKIQARFSTPAYVVYNADDAALTASLTHNAAFADWYRHNTRAHQQKGYRIVVVSLKYPGQPPGDINAAQLIQMADLAEHFSFGEVRVTHEQNLVLADVAQCDVYAVWQQLEACGLGTPNIGHLTDMISCPGGDFCNLANAKSFPVANAIQAKFSDFIQVKTIGKLAINMSGCMNACGHHHVGHIGVLGVDRKGEEYYQVSLGGEQGNQTALGKIIGPSFAAEEMPQVVEVLMQVYLQHRNGVDERFIDCVRRLGIEPFKTAVYAARSSWTSPTNTVKEETINV